MKIISEGLIKIPEDLLDAATDFVKGVLISKIELQTKNKELGDELRAKMGITKEYDLTKFKSVRRSFSSVLGDTRYHAQSLKVTVRVYLDDGGIGKNGTYLRNTKTVEIYPAQLFLERPGYLETHAERIIMQVCGTLEHELVHAVQNQLLNFNDHHDQLELGYGMKDYYLSDGEFDARLRNIRQLIKTMLSYWPREKWNIIIKPLIEYATFADLSVERCREIAEVLQAGHKANLAVPLRLEGMKVSMKRPPFFLFLRAYDEARWKKAVKYLTLEFNK